MSITVIGAGAFGTALAVAQAAGGKEVTLVARSEAAAVSMREANASPRLPDVPLPASISIVGAFEGAGAGDIVLLCIPAQTVGAWLRQNAKAVQGATLLACCKGIDVETLMGPAALIAQISPDATAGVLTGPSFAHDIARGLPTALTLATPDEADGERLQAALSTPALRLYRTTDVMGATLGGSLKNVIAIACGVAIGAGFGDSARAAVLTRGFSEMQRLATVLGARGETLLGMSGLGDLALTCTSEASRNYRYGLSVGKGEGFDAGTTVEGVATAEAATRIAAEHGLDLPITACVADLVSGRITAETALTQLLSRPLKEE